MKKKKKKFLAPTSGVCCVIIISSVEIRKATCDKVSTVYSEILTLG